MKVRRTVTSQKQMVGAGPSEIHIPGGLRRTPSTAVSLPADAGQWLASCGQGVLTVPGSRRH